MSARQIEMFWRCTSCKHRNLGRHQTCQSCGNPKDGSEEYEMPEDTSAAVTVTEEALLRMATAGPNWRCAYCESDQRAYDGKCKRCGASLPAKSQDKSPAPGKKSRKLRWGCLSLLFAGAMCCICAPPPQKSQTEAAKASWGSGTTTTSEFLRFPLGTTHTLRLAEGKLVEPSPLSEASSSGPKP